MKKKVITCLVLIIFILGGIYYKNNINVFKINKSKIKSVLYVYETDKNKMKEFDITNKLNEKDVSTIVDSLNNGVLRPDKDQIGKYTNEHIEMLVLGDRWFSVYKQNDGKFTVMYDLDISSNAENCTKQTTVDSKVLQNYFAKFRELSKDVTPTITWNTYIN